MDFLDQALLWNLHGRLLGRPLSVVLHLRLRPGPFALSRRVHLEARHRPGGRKTHSDDHPGLRDDPAPVHGRERPGMGQPGGQGRRDHCSTGGGRRASITPPCTARWSGFPRLWKDLPTLDLPARSEIAVLFSATTPAPRPETRRSTRTTRCMPSSESASEPGSRSSAKTMFVGGCRISRAND